MKKAVKLHLDMNDHVILPEEHKDLVICLLGLNASAKQLVHGLIVTDMTDRVSWGVYIANFTFLVDVAAAAVMLNRVVCEMADQIGGL